MTTFIAENWRSYLRIILEKRRVDRVVLCKVLDQVLVLKLFLLEMAADFQEHILVVDAKGTVLQFNACRWQLKGS